MIPFFVVDRPMSLNIIKTFFVNHPGVRFGLMTHALVSPRFRQLYADFPCDKSGCWLRTDHAECRLTEPCRKALQLRSAVVKAVDCGIFADKPRPAYPDLFRTYEEMRADYGIMTDTFRDPDSTYESALKGLSVYQSGDRRFELILVAQGKSVEEYVKSSIQLAELGVGKLAIGGLLNRNDHTVRYASAGSMRRMGQVLSAVRAELPEEWLFILGCYHPKRHALFKSYNVYGSDYKGWIFNYKHKLEKLAKVHSELLGFEAKLRRDSTMLRSASKRSQIWREAAKVRKNYATTRNRSGKDTEEKAKHRQSLDALLTRLQKLDSMLADMRWDEAHCDGLPKEYSILAACYRRLVGQTDQEVRVAGVHDYLARQVLPKLKPATLTNNRITAYGAQRPQT